MHMTSTPTAEASANVPAKRTTAFFCSSVMRHLIVQQQGGVIATITTAHLLCANTAIAVLKQSEGSLLVAYAAVFVDEHQSLVV